MPVPVLLLVDDEPIVRRTVGRLLVRAGYDVRVASTAAEAEAIARAEPALAAIVSDVMMDEVHGPELARRLHAIRPGVPVVFMSGEVPEHLPEMGVDPAALFVPKPFTPEVLLEAVRRAATSRAAGTTS